MTSTITLSCPCCLKHFDITVPGSGPWTVSAAEVPCEHRWQFLRDKRITKITLDDDGIELPPSSWEHIATDIFYCTKCLAKREVPA